MGCYLAIVRHVSATFGELTPLTSAADADGVLKPSYPKSKLDKERAKLDRQLLSTLLDFANGTRSWDSLVASNVRGAQIPFGELVRRVDEARATGSVDMVMSLRQALERLH